MSQPTTPRAPNTVSPGQAFKLKLDSLTSAQLALPSHINLDKFKKFVMLSIQKTPKLLECTEASLFAAVSRCAASGLVPDGKEAALIPYGPTAEFMPMIAGIAKLMRNSGELSSFATGIVYTNDKFRHWTDDTGEHIEHEPSYEEAPDSKLLGAYAILFLKDGSRICEFMTTKQLGDIRNASKSKKDSPWDGPFADEMMRKSPFKRASKRAPSSTDLDFVINADNALTDLEPTPASPAIEAPKTSSRLGALVASQAPALPPEPESEPIPEQDIPL